MYIPMHGWTAASSRRLDERTASGTQDATGRASRCRSTLRGSGASMNAWTNSARGRSKNLSSLLSRIKSSKISVQRTRGVGNVDRHFRTGRSKVGPTVKGLGQKGEPPGFTTDGSTADSAKPAGYGLDRIPVFCAGVWPRDRDGPLPGCKKNHEEPGPAGGRSYPEKVPGCAGPLFCLCFPHS